ncbi:MAG TPA: alanyl-tRNA editing protein [Rhizomicrobium sp.]|jgi:misacylated tRNA(Ala) deacylase|nr:alanyl-tRNA editing protein [Rhizomicrobium sp.]
MSRVTDLLFRDDAYLRNSTASVIAVDGGQIHLDRTIFYPLGGGQPGDRGTLKMPDGQLFQVVDTRKDEAQNSVIHVIEGDTAPLTVGSSVATALDWDYRYRLMRLHTCMHLLCAVVPGAVTGGQISDGKARLDFDVPSAGLDKDEITAKLNALIQGQHAVETRWVTDEELADKPELVRTMSVKPPTGTGRVRLLRIVDVDLQPCGGTHVRNTGEIGPVVVTKIENKGRQNRRINVAFAG